MNYVNVFLTLVLLSGEFFVSGEERNEYVYGGPSCYFSHPDFMYFVSIENVSEALDVGALICNPLPTTDVLEIFVNSEFVKGEMNGDFAVLTVIKSLVDFVSAGGEWTVEVLFELRCVDGSVESGEMMVSIRDENDHAPVFESSSYVYFIQSSSLLNATTEYDVPISDLPNPSIRVRDKDFLRENAEIELSCVLLVHDDDHEWNCTHLLNIQLQEIQGTSSSVSEGLFFKVQLNITHAGTEFLRQRNFVLRLTATDGLHEGVTQVDIRLDTNEDSPPGVAEVALTIPEIFFIAAGTLILISVLSLTAIFSWERLRKQRKELRKLDAGIREFREGTSRPYVIPRGSIDLNVPILSRPYDNQAEIPRQNLRIDETTVLGSGVYGTVLKGYVILPNKDTRTAAIKTVRRDADIHCFKALLTELKIMSYVGPHSNVLGLIGACTKNLRKREIYVAVELCANGNFRSYLKQRQDFFVSFVNGSGLLELRRNSLDSILGTVGRKEAHGLGYQSITTVDLIKWSFQISNGMEFIANKKVVHGDLAARNILLDDNLVCKIADFGLSKKLLDFNQINAKKTQSVQPLPWKYMAIESLRDLRFSLKTDVWTFGVLLWEIFTLGQKPFGAYSKYDETFLQRLADGERPELPTHATKEIHELLKNCWQEIPDKRPTFTDIKRRFAEILQNMGGYTRLLEDDEESNYGFILKKQSLSGSYRHLPPLVEEALEENVSTHRTPSEDLEYL